IYPEDTVKRIPKDIFKKYFSSNNKPGYFKISDEIMQCVSFQKHDLRSLIPIRDNFGLIVCKNVLLHFSEAERIKVIRIFHKALASGGFFATEQTQKMPKESTHLFKQIKPNIQLFQKT
ncbi:MAG: chemotaxis protein CheR, partial [Deltaproteobacteria bacterium]|nr:chemotaxis protein CheR [Deltaproteobacteria bacterium]